METPSNSPASAVEHFRMIDVGAKLATQRTAWAEGKIFVSSEVFQHLLHKTLPKGDALALAEIAGVMAAKNTALLIPLCHPLPIESVRVHCRLDEKDLTVTAHSEVRTTAKTGVEMEALAAVQAALLTIYDLSKGTDPALKMGEILLTRKEGGKSGVWIHPDRQSLEADKPAMATSPSQQLQGLRVAVVTVSDRCHQGLAEDRSGPLLADWTEQQGGLLGQTFLVPDEVPAIQEVVREAVERLSADLILLTGGTGLAPRDLTPEALRAIVDKEIPGFGELLRSSGAQHTPFSYLSRSFAGIAGHSLIIALPGSHRAVEQGLAALLPILSHAVHTIRGGVH